MKKSIKEQKLYDLYIEAKKHSTDIQYLKALREWAEYRYNHGNA
jgi:hypothetical protein